MRSIGRFVLILFAAWSALLPGLSAAANGEFMPPGWIKVRVGQTGEVWYPRDDFHAIAEIRPWLHGGGYDVRMLQGERWITLGREEVGMLGLSSDRIDGAVRSFSANPPIVIARYSPENAELRIAVIKIERGPDGAIRTWLGDFTPYSGERWRVYTRHYLTSQEAGNPDLPGRNPFAQFAATDPKNCPGSFNPPHADSPCTDPVFHDINWTAAVVAVGHAMAHYRAPIAFIAMSQSRFTQKKSSSGSLFKKTVKIEVDGYARPVWYVALPKEAQPYGQDAAICVIPGAQSCNDPDLVARAGVRVMRWEGGNMPATEDHLYHWEESHSSFTVLAYGIVVGLLSLAGAPMLSNVLDIPSAAKALFDTVAYIAESTALGGHGGPLSAQDGFYGATDSGYFDPNATWAASGSEQARGMADAVKRKLIDAPLQNSLTGVREQYSGNCPESWTTAQCRAQGLDPGTLPRPDQYTPYNAPLALRAAYEKCREMGYAGAQLEQCAAPRASGVFSQPALQ